MDNYYVYITKLPGRIREYVTPCIDGYTVYISDELEQEQRIEAFHHAVRHVERGDFEKEDVQVIEHDARLQ